MFPDLRVTSNDFSAVDQLSIVTSGDVGTGPHCFQILPYRPAACLIRAKYGVGGADNMNFLVG